jgi:hypothetical protein
MERGAGASVIVVGLVGALLLDVSNRQGPTTAVSASSVEVNVGLKLGRFGSIRMIAPGGKAVKSSLRCWQGNCIWNLSLKDRYISTRTIQIGIAIAIEIE